MNTLEEFAAAFLGFFQSKQFDRIPTTSIDSFSVEDAYQIQRMLVESRLAKGERVIGYKIGCTSNAIREQFGLSEPVSGRLLHPHVHFDNVHLDWQKYYQPAVEPEFVLGIGKDLTEEIEDEASLEQAIDFVSPGIEIHNYHFWFGKPTLQELIASNAIHACLVVGETKYEPRNFNWDMEGVGIFVNEKLAASGIGAEIMGGPMKSLRWLVNHLVRRGEPLQAGHLVIPGSPVPLISVKAGDKVTARFTHTGNVEVVFRSGATT